MHDVARPWADDTLRADGRASSQLRCRRPSARSASSSPSRSASTATTSGPRYGSGSRLRSRRSSGRTCRGGRRSSSRRRCSAPLLSATFVYASVLVLERSPRGRASRRRLARRLGRLRAGDVPRRRVHPARARLARCVRAVRAGPRSRRRRSARGDLARAGGSHAPTSSTRSDPCSPSRSWSS